MSTSPRNSLDRFLAEQEGVYDKALSEIRGGRKRTSWMWFIFPQLRGLGRSAQADFLGIQDLEEAQRYLAHPVLGARIHECAQAALEIIDGSAFQVFGFPDHLKLRSCATLFSRASPSPNIFDALLEKFYDGDPDPLTIERLQLDPKRPPYKNNLEN